MSGLNLKVLIAGVLSLGGWTIAAPPPTAPARPNVVFILADDIGYGDFGCYGATKVKTPNVDHFAAQGLRFTDAHSPSAVCTPTRYALLTGEYAWRHRAGDHILPGDAPLSITPGTLTVPALMKEAGYRTAAIGKWHVGLGNGEIDWNGEIKPGPLEVGFDECFIIPATGDRTPCVYVEDHHVYKLDPHDPITVDYKNSKPGHSNVVSGIGRIGAMTGGKAALWKDDEIGDTLCQRAVSFIERNKSRPFFLYLATHEIHVPRMPAARYRGTSQAGVRGDDIQEFDGVVGEVLGTLDRLGLTQDTLVIVTSDNGGVLDHGDSIERDGDVASNNGHAFNGALRGTKGTPYEGGTRIPFVARWPGHIRTGNSDQTVCQVDTLATMAALIGHSLPAEAGPDSFNVLPLLLGVQPDKPVRDHLIEHSRRMGVRQGFWKLVFDLTGNQPPELYDLSTDLGESKDVAHDHPEKVEELSLLLKRVRESGHSRPGR